MQLEIKWFIDTLVQNSLLSVEDGIAFHDQLGGEPDLITFVQALLEQFTNGKTEEEAQGWTEQFQSVIEYAQSQAATGAEPASFANLARTETPAPAEAPVPPPPAPAPAAAQAPAVLSEQPREEGCPVLADVIAKIRTVSSMSDAEAAEYMKSLLLAVRGVGGSDLHLSSNAPVFIRKDLMLQRLDPDWVLPDADCHKLNFSILTDEQKQIFEKEQDMNFALEIGSSRFRAAVMYHKDGMSGTYRLVPGKIKSLAELGFLPADVKTVERLLDYNNGLILVTGPLGSGKTTTLASMVEVANQHRQDHVITVEDPIEIVIRSKGCQITQRQVGTCTNSYRAALKGALREDPDIIVIGEMHDLETIENAITASETGHLVIGTLHTCDAANTLNRVLDVFPPTQQAQIRAMTAGSLRGIICQKLIPAANGGVTICYEILINTLAVSNIIQEGKIFQLNATMQIGSKSGMCTLSQNLYTLYKEGRITEDVAKQNITDKAVMELLMKDIAVSRAKEFAAQNQQKKKK